MKLEELLEGVSYQILQKPAGAQEAKESGAADKDIAEKDIPAIVFDNRKVTEGCLFVCVKGMKYDSHEHVEEIAAAGAKVIVVEQEITLPAYPEVTVLKVASTRYAMAFIVKSLRRRSSFRSEMNCTFSGWRPSLYTPSVRKVVIS